MTLPTSGGLAASQINIELGRAQEASFSLDGTAERALARKSSGSISFEDFYGKSSEISVTLPAGGTAVTLQSQFSTEDWASDTTKRVIVMPSVERGNSSTAAAVTIGSTPWGGTLIFDVRGTISGRGGAANAGVGGDAFHANLTGNQGQKLELLVSGVLRGGGGGGGKGGAGGKGSVTGTVRDPASGWRAVSEDYGFNKASPIDSRLYLTEIIWAGESVWSQTRQGGPFFLTGPQTVDGYTYIAPSYGVGDQNVARTSSGTTATTGGAGGNGGVGEGYGTTRTNGASGATGGTNAGKGGAGGAGGLYGATGGTGSTGANGNSTNGAKGVAGGAAGRGLLGSANVNLTNTGYIIGRTE